MIQTSQASQNRISKWSTSIQKGKTNNNSIDIDNIHMLLIKLYLQTPENTMNHAHS